LFEKPMICATIFEEKPQNVLKSANKAKEIGVDILEFRIDRLKNPIPEEVQDLIIGIDYPIIATNRSKNEGGFFSGSEIERLDILLKISQYADFIDIELETPSKILKKIIKSSKKTIISYHNFNKTPKFDELLKIVYKEIEIGDLAKFSVMPHNFKDTLTVLRVLSEVKNTIGISMGDLGRYTRIVAPIFGSPITYASINKKSAPGQMDISTLKNILMALKVIN
jgi:3-dehydroquinate dehydratase I